MISELFLITGVAFIIYAFYKWATLNDDYFEKRGVKFLKPKFLIGNTGGLFFNRYSAAEFTQMLYNGISSEKIYGMFDLRSPLYVIRDPEVIKQLAVKDSDHFVDHRSHIDSNSDKLLGNCLVFLQGEKWRDMRASLSPAFTGSKMRQMFELVSECAEDMVKYCSKQAERNENINLEMKEFFLLFTNDVIASCAFGIKVNSLEDPNNDYTLNVKSSQKFSLIFFTIKMFFTRELPFLSKLFKIQLIDGRVSKFFTEMVLNTIKDRKRLNIFRPDMINILMHLSQGKLQQQSVADEKNQKKTDSFATVEEVNVGKAGLQREWNDDEIVAQCFLFFFAGFESIATMLTFASYELVVNPNIQAKLYEEIYETNKNLDGKRINYDVLQKMKYLDQFICETLRKWPPNVFTDRSCVKDYNFDDGENLKFRFEKGVFFWIPTFGIHHDPKYYPDPEKFDPERFSDENKGNIIPGTYLPFGVGPRNCIGSRFAVMEVKIILYYMLLNFSFEANSKTQIPLKLKKSPFILALSMHGLFFDLKRRMTNES